MGLNLSQIINKFVPTKEQDAIGWENPLGTPQGQIQVGQSEGLFQYYARKGLLQQKSIADQVFASTASFTWLLGTSAPASGKTQYGLRAVIGSTSSGLMSIVCQNNNDAQTQYLYYYVQANQSAVINLDGCVWSSLSSALAITFRPDTANAKASATMYWVEV